VIKESESSEIAVRMDFIVREELEARSYYVAKCNSKSGL
jgi:hypothetical protein